jgi:DNA polymerase delta subunit 1
MLDSCDPIPDVHVLSFMSETAMLDAWRKFVTVVDPDVITGYNINKFDIPFLIDRARVIKASRLPYFGRLVKSPASYRKILNKDKRINIYADTTCTIAGRIIFDMLPVIRILFPHLQSFKLGDVSKQLLDNEDKDDVHFTDIFKLQNMSPRSRSKLARYCLQDALLAMKLIFKNPSNDGNEDYSQNIISCFCEKSRCSGSPLRYLVTKSRAYQEYCKTVRKQKNPGVVFPPTTPYPSSKKRRTERDHKRSLKVRRSLFGNEDSPK